MSESDRFAPKVPVELNPPKDDPITLEELAKADGEHSDKIYVAIKGTVFDVTRNAAAYGPGRDYHIFAGKDASRGLATSSLDPVNAVPEYEDLPEKQQKILSDWFKFFTLRYNIIGKVVV